jgi:molecular chaperone GrpE (heat shock protein)
LAADGVTRIKTIGELFDPYLHVAVGTRSAETETEQNCIASEQKAGYRNAQGVLRYAEVIVKK